MVGRHKQINTCAQRSEPISLFDVYLHCLNSFLAYCLNRFLKATVGFQLEEEEDPSKGLFQALRKSSLTALVSIVMVTMVNIGMAMG